MNVSAKHPEVGLLLFCSIVCSVNADDLQIPLAGSQLKDFKSCLSNTNVDLSYPSNETWWYDSQSVYVPVLRHPIAVAYAESASQVSELVKCATKHKVKVNPRSGGHSYEAFCNEDHHLVIDVGRIDFVSIEDQTATVGAGIRLGRLYYELRKHRMVFPTASTTTLGLAGLVSAGGSGFLTRLWGLSADNVLELEMVDYRGEVLVANSDKNDDLFFALRGGGGGSYGIMTKMKLRVYPYPPLSTAFAISWDQPIAASQLSRVWFEWKPWDSMSREMNCEMYYSSNNNSVLTGFYVGEDGHLGVERILNESGGLLELGGNHKYEYYSSRDLLEARAWLDNGKVHYGNDSDYRAYNVPPSFIFKPLNLPPHPTPVHPTWAHIQNDSRVNATHSDDTGVGSIGPVPNQERLRIDHDYMKYTSQIVVKEFDDAAHKALEEYVNQDGASLMLFTSGGVMSTFADDFNAFPHRNMLFRIQYFTPYHQTGSRTYSGIDGQKELSRKILTAIEAYTNHRSYQGNADLVWTTDPKIYMPRYYGGNVDRLIKAKATYDPLDLFSNGQSTPTNNKQQ